MTKQDTPTVFTEQAQDEVVLNHIFETDTVICQYQGPMINFSLPLDTQVNEDQIDRARKAGYKLVSFGAVVNKSGMRDHLHIWLTKIADWEKKQSIIEAVKAL